MKQTKHSSHKLNNSMLLLAAASILFSIIAPADRRAAAPAYAAPSQGTVFWHAGNFRYLDTMTGDLLTFVQALQHPNSGGYGKLSTTRKGNFNTFLDALFTAIDDSLNDGSTGDWCGVKTKATTAGYAVYRFYDTVSGRWFVYGEDTTSFGQSYFFINPFAKRNIVIEVPHEGLETNTGAEGVRLFRALAARALLVNKEHRCSDPDASVCADGQPTNACSGYLRESDVAHHTANTFYLLHKRYTDMDPVTKFVQLHGMGSSPSDMVEVGDGTTRDLNTGSVSVAFANSLDSFVPSPGAVNSCQEATGYPPSQLCAETNVEGRYTNGHDLSDCPAGTTNGGTRFIAVEQALTLRDDDDSDGWYWGDVRDALISTWPDCNMNNGATDCTLGPQQTQYTGLSCSVSKVFAPYVDMGLPADWQLANVQTQSGIKVFTLAFVVGNGGCTPTWSGVGVTVANDTLPNGNTILSQVQAIRAAGGDVIISFGGASGNELAQGCSTVSSLQAAYQSVLNKYSVNSSTPVRLDFDIEGGATTDQTSITRRNQTLKNLKSANPGLVISYTLAVLPTGLVPSGVNILNSAKTDGLSLDVVNVMAMNYGPGNDNGGQMGLSAQQAASNTHNQVVAAGLSASIGVTPMIGINDTSSEIFQLTDAQSLLNFANSNSYITRIAMWSVARDNGGCAGQGFASSNCSGISQSNWAFANIFKPFSS